MLSANGQHSDARSYVTVVVRVRAANTKEREQNLPPAVKVIDDNVIVFDPKVEQSPDFYRGKKRNWRDLNKRVSRNVFFAFDHVFDEFASNVDVFEHTTKSIIDDVMDGYNSCG